MKYPIVSFFLIAILGFTCCSTDLEDRTEVQIRPFSDALSAEVTDVNTSGAANNYTFSVTIKSPDTGCGQYADWWEVIDTDGNLIHRRILAHSHVDEQPFTRSGNNIVLSPDQEIYIRAHMNNRGYGNKVFRGTVANGFSSTELDPDFAKELEEQQPLPTSCAF